MNTEFKNVAEFKALIKKYESITIEDLKNLDVIHGKPDYKRFLLRKITGFGVYHLCTLCNYKDKAEFENSCYFCVYSSTLLIKVHNTADHCMRVRFKNKHTYQKIDISLTLEELLSAIKLRAKHMRYILKTLKIKCDE